MRDVLSLGAFVILQYWVLERARARFERLGGGAGAAAIGSTAPRARVDNACSTHPLADVLVPITSESIATWYAVANCLAPGYDSAGESRVLHMHIALICSAALDPTKYYLMRLLRPFGHRKSAHRTNDAVRLPD